MSKRNIILVLANVVLAVCLFVWWTSLKMPAPAPHFAQHQVNFHLQHDQQVVSEKVLHNKVGFIFLGDMHCDAACPEVLMRMRLSLESLNDDERKKVIGLFIDLQAVSESSSEVAKLARFFHPKLLGLSGNSDELKSVAKTLFFEKSIKQLRKEHPHTLLVVRPDGYVAVRLKPSDNVATIVATLRTWLVWVN